MKSSQNTLWVAGAGVLAVLLVVATYFLLVAPQRSEAADLASQRDAVEQTNAQIAQRTEQLKSQFSSLEEKRAELKSIQAQLPSQAEVPNLLRQLSAYATSAGLQVSSVTTSTPENFSTSSSTETAATDAAASGIVAIPVTVTVKGTYPQVELYTKNVQADLTRHILVQGITVAQEDSGATSSIVTGTLTGSIFVLTDDSSATATSDSSSTGTATETATVSS